MNIPARTGLSRRGGAPGGRLDFHSRANGVLSSEKAINTTGHRLKRQADAGWKTLGYAEWP